MKKLNLNLLLLVMAILTFTSCSQRLIDFTVISSKNANIGVDKTKGVRTVGKSMQFLMIGVNIKDAVDNALQKAGAKYDLLIDGVVRVEQYPFYGAYVYGGYVVEGTAVSSRDLKAALGEKGFEDFCSSHQIFNNN